MRHRSTLFATLIIMSLLAGNAVATESYSEDVRAVLAQAAQLTSQTDFSMWQSFGRLYAQVGNCSEAEGMFNRALQAIFLMFHDDRDYVRESQIWHLMRLASEQAQAGLKAGRKATFEAAEHTIGSMKNEGYQLSGLGDMAVAQLHQGDPLEAKKYIAEALRTGEELPDRDFRRSKLLATFAIAQVEVNDRTGAGETLALAYEYAKHRSDPIDHAKALIAIAVAEIAMGQTPASGRTVDEAFQIMSRLEKDSERPRVQAFARLARAYAQAGDQRMAELMVDKAQAIARSLPDGTTRSALFRDIALTQVKIGKLMEALQTEHEITDPSYAGQSLPDIAEAQIEAGNLEEAMKTAELLTTVDPIRKEDIIGKVATRYARRGDVTTARQLSRHLSDIFRVAVLQAMANFAVQAGQIPTATALVNESIYDYEKIFALLGMAEGMLGKRAGDFVPCNTVEGKRSS